ncbi:NAD(P)-dependent oxidoreductase [Alcaligenes parafaecalis]|uniref:NAD(P)-dependent oxidoreductase n=1 Tax=Alcaligenes parafaecalis TaxID=171260 RepID=A0ABT3VR69_9BURK|nr:NAD(P)-dependent oxidoreductase [Alcaligenes parafaecalis]MCX5464621.1 NAD(P)-dependent oxidoreductase [Alcaligenes parafaecalis]
MSPSIQPKSYESLAPQKVAFIGLGVMGYPMAGHLAQAGHQVTVYNRNQAKAKQWSAEFKQEWAATPALAAAQADIVMACVGNDDDLRAIFLGPDGALAGMKAGSLFIDHTTASAEVAQGLGALAAHQNVAFIDAPISGGQAGAQKGMLSIMCGGKTEDMERARPLMMSYAQACTLMGPLGSGQLCKMVNQIAVVGLLQALAEAMAFGERAGLDMEQALSVLTKGAARSWQMETKGPTMLARDFQPGFTVNWMLKDLDLVQQEAQRNGAQLPGTRLIQEQFAKIAEQGHRDLDISSLFSLLARPGDAS